MLFSAYVADKIQSTPHPLRGFGNIEIDLFRPLVFTIDCSKVVVLVLFSLCVAVWLFFDSVCVCVCVCVLSCQLSIVV